MKEGMEGRNMQNYLDESFTLCIGSDKGTEVKILMAFRLEHLRARKFNTARDILVKFPERATKSAVLHVI